MPIFPLVYTHTLMDIVLSMAELNKYIICHLHLTKAYQSSLVI